MRILKQRERINVEINENVKRNRSRQNTAGLKGRNPVSK